MSYFPSAREAARALGLPLLLRAEPDPRAFRRHDWLGTLAAPAASAARMYVLALDELSRTGGEAIGVRGAMSVLPGAIWVTGPWGSLAHLPWAVGLADHLARTRGRAGLLERDPDGPLQTLARPGRRVPIRLPLAEALLGGSVDAVNTDLEGISILLPGAGQARVEDGTQGAAAGDVPLVLADGLPEALEGPYPGANWVAGVILVASFRDHSRFELDAVVRRLRETGHRLLGLTAIGPEVSDAEEAAALRMEGETEPAARDAAGVTREAQWARVDVAPPKADAAPGQAGMPRPAVGPEITGGGVLSVAAKTPLSPPETSRPALGPAPVPPLPPPSARPPATEPESRPVSRPPPGATPAIGPGATPEITPEVGPEAGALIAPGAGPENGPEAGLEIAPEAGSGSAREAESEIAAEAGLEIAPAAESEISPEAEAEITPAAESEISPEAEAETTPETEAEPRLGGPPGRRDDRATIALLSTWDQRALGRSRRQRWAGRGVAAVLVLAVAAAFYGVVLRPRLRPLFNPSSFKGESTTLPTGGADSAGASVRVGADSAAPAAESTGTAAALTGTAAVLAVIASESTGTAVDTGRVAEDSGRTRGEESGSRVRQPVPGFVPGSAAGSTAGSAADSSAVPVASAGLGGSVGAADTTIALPGGDEVDLRAQFVIHLTSFKLAAEAEIEVNALRQRGIEARSIEAEIPDRGTWYRIVTGNFATFAEAESVALRLQAEGKIPYAHIAADGGRGLPVPVGTLDRARP